MRSIAAAIVACLDRRTGDGGKGAKDATIAWQWSKEFLASLTLIEPLTSVGWHDLGFDMPTAWAGDCRLQHDLIGRHSHGAPSFSTDVES